MASLKHGCAAESLPPEHGRHFSNNRLMISSLHPYIRMEGGESDKKGQLFFDRDDRSRPSLPPGCPAASSSFQLILSSLPLRRGYGGGSAFPSSRRPSQVGQREQPQKGIPLRGPERAVRFRIATPHFGHIGASASRTASRVAVMRSRKPPDWANISPCRRSRCVSMPTVRRQRISNTFAARASSSEISGARRRRCSSK